MRKIRESINLVMEFGFRLTKKTDVEGLFIANVIVGTLETEKSGKMFLLNTEELEKVDHSTVSKLFNRSLSIFCSDGIKRG